MPQQKAMQQLKKQESESKKDPSTEKLSWARLGVSRLIVNVDSPNQDLNGCQEQIRF